MVKHHSEIPMAEAPREQVITRPPNSSSGNPSIPVLVT